jgi:ribosomal protein S18 acetylase RimI-like enzyme
MPPTLSAPASDTITFHETAEISPELVIFLSLVTWGTQGARYRLTDGEYLLSRLPNPRFLLLRKNDRIVALNMLLKKQARVGTETLPVTYHSLLSVDPAEVGKGYGRNLAEQTVRHLRAGGSLKNVTYCHVEKSNTRSLRLFESLGYENLGECHAMAFCRLWPRCSNRVARLSLDQESQMRELLRHHYAGHALTDFESSLWPERYHVLSDGTSIIAGVQAVPMRMRVHHLAGIGGWLATRALPRAPLLRRLFNPHDFRFLRIGNIFFETGRAARVFELLEHVLAIHQVRTAVMLWDKTSPVYQDLAAAGSLGLLNPLVETPLEIMGLIEGRPQNFIQELRRLPKMISAIDL